MATPVGTARAEDPGLNEVKEAAEAVPTESVRSERKSTAYQKPMFMAHFYILLIY